MSKRPRLRQAIPAGELVLAFLQQQGLEGKIEEYRAWQVWDQAVGPQIAARARPVRIREGVLEVRVEQATWMQQLQLLKPKILVKVNEALGKPVIRDIFWRRGTLDKTTAVIEPPRPDWRSVTLSAAEEGEIQQTAAPFTDPELRHAFERLLSRQKRLEKAQQKLAQDKTE